MPKKTRLCDELGISFEQCRRLRQKAIAAFDRCHNKCSDSWDNYGGRGIQVEFLDVRSFVVHLLTLDGWDNPTLMLDRRDNDKNYTPGNLRFVTSSESHSNIQPRFNLVAQLCANGTADRIAEMYIEGHAVVKIAETFDIHYMVVYRCLQWYRKQSSTRLILPKRNR